MKSDAGWKQRQHAYGPGPPACRSPPGPRGALGRAPALLLRSHCACLRSLLTPILRLVTSPSGVTKHVARDARAVVLAVRLLVWLDRIFKRRDVLEGHTVYSCVFSPNGKRVVTASKVETARLWDAETGALPTTVEGHTGRLFSCAFSPDGTRILTAGIDKTARLWNVITYLQGLEATSAGFSLSDDRVRLVRDV